MGSAYLWVKAFHIVFVASWFAGLFYLPRLFVNLAMVAPDSHAERERLLLMARKLYRFAGILMLPAVVLGLVLWLGYGVGLGAGHGWMHPSWRWCWACWATTMPAAVCCAASNKRQPAQRALVPGVQRELGVAVRRHRGAGGRQAVLIGGPVAASTQFRRATGVGLCGTGAVCQPVPLCRLALATGPVAGRAAGAALAAVARPVRCLVQRAWLSAAGRAAVRGAGARRTRRLEGCLGRAAGRQRAVLPERGDPAVPARAGAVARRLGAEQCRRRRRRGAGRVAADAGAAAALAGAARALVRARQRRRPESAGAVAHRPAVPDPGAAGRGSSGQPVA